MVYLAKMLVQLSILVLCHTALAVPMQPVYDVENLDLVKNLFEKFIVKYKRNYIAGEKLQKFQHFKHNLAEINRLNQDNPKAWFGINKFSDWSPEELKTLTGLKKNVDTGSETSAQFGDHGLCKVTTNVSTHDAPDAFDWKDNGAVTPVKNQEDCQSCWAFSATAAVESAYAIKYKKQLNLSEQQLVDCDNKSNGCSGGDMATGLSKLIEEGGQELESDYPYLDKDGDSCQFNKSQVAVKVTACDMYDTLNDEQIKEALFKNGPLSIGIDAQQLTSYHTGILTNCSSSKLNHGVLLVGYGTEQGLDFWNIKNSWGPEWGEQGFFRMNRGDACLGLGQFVVSATIE